MRTLRELRCAPSLQLTETPMNLHSLQSRWLLLSAGVCAMTMSSVSIASDANTDGEAAGCSAQFEKAQRLDMESFRDYDAETFRAGHHPDAVTIFASGAK